MKGKGHLIELRYRLRQELLKREELGLPPMFLRGDLARVENLIGRMIVLAIFKEEREKKKRQRWIASLAALRGIGRSAPE